MCEWVFVDSRACIHLFSAIVVQPFECLQDVFRGGYFLFFLLLQIELWGKGTTIYQRICYQKHSTLYRIAGIVTYNL